ncbi:MAG: hypothetical protein Q8R31_03330 [Candidatus Omnitrophota bacterium]|nr:hypothetical protein [Candidatus Omnitrophota bacterium]
MHTKEKPNGYVKVFFLSLLQEGQPIYVDARGGSMYPFIKKFDATSKELDKEMADLLKDLKEIKAVV